MMSCLVTTVTADQLFGGLQRRWAELQQSNPTLDSPFVHAEFTSAVAAVRQDVEVAVVERRGTVVAFLPFQRLRNNVGKPVGYPMNDFQGMVARGCPTIDPIHVVRACRLRAWDFDHLAPCEPCFAPYVWSTASAPYIDLSAGFDAYRANAVNPKSRDVRAAMRRCREAERDFGPVRFAMDQPDPRVLEQLIEWKNQQYLRTGVPGILTIDWTVALLRRLLRVRTESFQGMLSTLHFGDRLAAAHFGLFSRGVLHGWFPAFDVALGSYSPGMILWLKSAEAAQRHGIRRIDLGKGDERFKRALMSGTLTVREGSVACAPMARLVRHGYRHARGWAQRSRFGEPLRRMAQAVLRFQQKLTYR